MHPFGPPLRKGKKKKKRKKKKLEIQRFFLSSNDRIYLGNRSMAVFEDDG
jgi:hypothetical protein